MSTERLARLLAATAGYVDGVGYVALLRLFTAHQSGNSAGLGVALSGGDWTTAWRRGTAIGAYVMGVALGTYLVERCRRSRPRWSGTVVAIAELAALGVALGVGQAAAVGGTITSANSGPYAAAAAALAGGMGLQSVILRRVHRRTVRTTFVTGILTNMAETFVVALSTRRSHRRRLLRFSGLLGSIWLTYLAGAVAGGAAEREWSFAALVVPIAAIVVVAAWLRWSGYEPSLPSRGLTDH
ncbi:MAG: YoaK family protein [Acidimicrobiales bacterium]